jgi:pentatricopeptide repeat protein
MSGPSYVPGVRDPEDAMSVEEVVQLLKRLPKSEALPESAQRALYHFDSRAVALLLKDLSKAGQDGRAIELFDWVRQLPDRHLLRALCDVYTYTAMISLCIYQQNIDRAMELMNEMTARNIERNVHTYTAMMNVCIKCGKLTAALEMYAAMRAAKCTPNVVTFNTLIDVYGKLGQWDKAVQVLRIMRSEVSPPTRWRGGCAWCRPAPPSLPPDIQCDAWQQPAAVPHRPDLALSAGSRWQGAAPPAPSSVLLSAAAVQPPRRRACSRCCARTTPSSSPATCATSSARPCPCTTT